MEPHRIAFLVIGGLGLFLLGIRTMSDALRRAAGDRMRRVLRILTYNIFVSVLAGTGITCLIQSSSATTVMVVGFVNAGLMTLKQAIGVIMGANIGTTITAWLVSTIGLLEHMKVTDYALPAIGIGFAVSVIAKRNGRHWGSALLGFGLLFFGLALMKDAFDPVGQSQEAKDLLIRVAGNPLMGLLIGTVVTMVVQSSSATIAIVQLLAMSNAITFVQALPIVFGDDIGTTITAQLASIGTNTQARRAARAHLVFNVLGVCIFMPFYKSYASLIEAIYPGPLNEITVMAHIALSHTMFKVVNTLIFIGMPGVLLSIAKRMVPGEADVIHVEPQYLEERLVSTPVIALEQARREVVRMMDLAVGAVRNAGDAFFHSDPKELKLVAQKEDAIDNLQNRITQYLIRVSRESLGSTESNELPVLLHSVNDIERIGDHAVNLMEAAQRRIESQLPFSEAGLQELAMMRDEVERMCATVVRALEESNEDAARAAFASEEKLNAMQREFRQNHLTRLSLGDCNFYSGLTFVDCLYYYEKIGDHLTNIAQAVLGDFQWGEKMPDNEEIRPQAPAQRPPASS
ncbi:MAG: Na/Pi cotransporter family protein [Candidatus Brocadiaceae bacterium]|nr:Na/Pi cotransporter family protein [Candidatus Brocadiaceae bacterium]